MAINLNLRIIGLKSFQKKIKDKANKIKNQRKKLFSRLAVLGFIDIQDHFKQEEGPTGKWRNLQPATIENRRQGKNANFGFKILQDTGSLRNSLMPNIGSKIVRSNSVFTSIGGSQKGVVNSYASAHNFGDKKRNIPQRGFMWISEKAKEAMIEQVRKFIG